IPTRQRLPLKLLRHCRSRPFGQTLRPVRSCASETSFSPNNTHIFQRPVAMAAVTKLQERSRIHKGDTNMKSVAKFTLMILALALASWAQTATQNPTSPRDTQKASAAQSETKAECPCCQKMAESKDAMSCCAHHNHAKGA